MKHPIFHEGEECYIKQSAAIPHLSGRECTIIGGLARRAVYDDFGNHIGYQDSYKIIPDGCKEPVCAPEGMLRKKFIPCNSQLKKIWQPKPVKVVRRPHGWKEWR
jgi:hypothetical protein